MSDKDAKPPMKWIESPDGVCEIYANTLHTTWSLDDVRIRLAQLVDSPETPNPGPDFLGAAEERAAVTLSWRNAKVLRDELSGVIENYERTNGPIRLDVKMPSSVS